MNLFILPNIFFHVSCWLKVHARAYRKRFLVVVKVIKDFVTVEIFCEGKQGKVSKGWTIKRTLSQ